MIWWMLFFFLAGMALILAEFIVPGGICGLVGAILVIVSGGIGLHAYPEWTSFIIAGELLGAVLSIVFGMTILTRTNAAKRLVLETSQMEEDGYTNAITDGSLVGRTAVVLTALRPAGTVQLDGRRIDAVSNGMFIDKDAEVRIVEVHGNRVVVESTE
jgi:membrane-bound serine protease (ClpP class)